MNWDNLTPGEYDSGMSVSSRPNLKRKRGNRNWGKPLSLIPRVLTEFEMEVVRLHLNGSDYLASVELKRWCYQNRNRLYVPEWLLKEWGMHVELNFSEAA
jgi:hypothetical protein